MRDVAEAGYGIIMIQRHSWYENVALRLRFTAVFQGGGIRGLFFPGHVFGLLKKGVSKIGAYSGASAGALIAVGLWSGLYPHRILDELKDRSGLFGLFWSIVSPFDLLTLIFGVFVFLLVESLNLLLFLIWRVLFLHRLLKKNAPAISKYYGCRGLRFEKLINDIILSGLGDRAIHKRFIVDVTGKDPYKEYLTFKDILQITYWTRLVSSITGPSGDDFEAVKKTYPHFDFENAIFSFNEYDRSGNQKNDILDQIYGVPTASDPYFYPLFLSLCDIKTRQPVIISSIDPKCLDVTIASAVRASAGHPFVFKPCKINMDNEQHLCTDGGLIYNLPTITLYRDLPYLLRLISKGQHPFIRPDEHTDLTRSPLTIIGLASEDYEYNPTYLKLLFGTISGGGRNYLEYKIAEFAPYIRHIRHKTRLGEPYFLNFVAARKRYMTSCFNSGSELIKSTNFSTQVTLDHYRDDIQKSVEDVCKFVHSLFCDSHEDFVRAHLFVEGRETQGVLDKKLFSYFGEVDRIFADEDFSMVGHGRYAGIVGLCVLSGKMVIARLDAIQEMRYLSQNETFLNLKWDQVSHIPKEINLCFAIPIYDYRQLHYKLNKMNTFIDPEYKGSVATIDCGVSGPIAGVLSIDMHASVETNLSHLIDSLLEKFAIQTLERLAINLSSTISSAMSELSSDISKGLSA